MSQDEAEKPKQIRLHIGAISPQLAESIGELEARFAKYGTVVSPIELHHREILNTYYGYLEFKTTPKEYIAMKKAFSKVKFKESVISIQTAKPDYKLRWTRDQARPDPPPSKDALKRRYGKPRREIDVIPGRIRKTPRKKYRYMTFRIIIGSTKKIIKCPKKKLWGFLRDRKLDEVSWQYANGQWRDGNGDVIETVDFQPVVAKPGVGLLGGNKDKPTETSEGDIDDEIEQERLRNLSILEKMFGSVGEDYVPKASVDSRHDDFEEPVKPESEDESNSSSASDSSNASDSDDDSSSSSSEQEEDDDMADWESHPNFQKVDAIETEDKKEEEVASVEEVASAKPVNSTKTLRGLFNPAEGSGQFSLFGDNFAEDDDLDNTVLQEIDEAEAKQKKASKGKGAESSLFAGEAMQPVSSVRKGLFFGHFESPFLSSQSQVALLPTLQFDSKQWDELFYSKRSDWAKKFKGRRREALRVIEKKNKARRRTAAA